MDPELETLLSALLDGQLKLAEGQAALVVAQQKTEARINALAEGQAALVVAQQKTEARIDALAAATNELSADVGLLAKAVGRMDDRLERFTDSVMRGFTSSSEHRSALEERVGRLEQTVFGEQP